MHRKVYLPTYGMFDEGRDFAAGDRFRAFATRNGPAGRLICEDAWHPSSAWILVQDGAEILFTVSSGPTRGAKPRRGITSLPIWHELLRTTAQLQTSFVVYVNRVGYEDGLNFGGGSIALDPFGRTIASLPALTAGVTVAELDGEVLRRARAAYPLLRDENHRARAPARSRASAGASIPAPAEPREEPGVSATAHLARRPPREPDLSLDVATPRCRSSRDSSSPSGARLIAPRSSVGLSGGIDPTPRYRAVRALGPSGVVGVLMPHRTSSASSVRDAEAVVGALGIVAERFEISELVDVFSAKAGNVGPRRLGNVMARVRMLVLYDRSVEHDALVLGTSNKTELLLGYGTVHGDLASALNPLGDLYKTQVRELSRAPVPKSILEKPPSADLWPDQTDQADLGVTYDEVDRILAPSSMRASVRGRSSPGVSARDRPRQAPDHALSSSAGFGHSESLDASIGWDFRYHATGRRRRRTPPVVATLVLADPAGDA